MLPSFQGGASPTLALMADCKASWLCPMWTTVAGEVDRVGDIRTGVRARGSDDASAPADANMPVVGREVCWRAAGAQAMQCLEATRKSICCCMPFLSFQPVAGSTACWNRAASSEMCFSRDAILKDTECQLPMPFDLTAAQRILREPPSNSGSALLSPALSLSLTEMKQACLVVQGVSAGLCKQCHVPGFIGTALQPGLLETLLKLCQQALSGGNDCLKLLGPTGC